MPRLPYTPRPYQDMMRGFAHDVPRCAWWVGMGMGKTSSGLTLLSDLQLIDASPALVIAPLRVAKDTWPTEAAKWDHLAGTHVVPIVGSETERRAALAQLKRSYANVFTINYDNVPWLVEVLGDDWPFGTGIADEATRLKSFRLSGGGRRARALGRVAHKHFKRFVELTGTPSPNGLIDLWGQMWFLDGGVRLGRTMDAFKQRWFRPKFDGYGVEPLECAQEQIHERLRDVCLTLDPKDWFDLQDPIVSPVYVDLPGKARAMYREMEKKLYLEIGDRSVEALNAASKSMKLLQLANGAVYLDPAADDDSHPKSKDWREVHDVKLQALESIVEEAGGSPVLVAYRFRSDLERLKRAFPKGRVLANEDEFADFKAGRAPLGFAHPKSMGHGIDGLQEHCHHLAGFGHDWNLEEWLQIIERIGPVRQAQAKKDRPVYIYPIIARDTVDEDVMVRRETKREVQDVLLESMKRRAA